MMHSISANIATPQALRAPAPRIAKIAAAHTGAQRLAALLTAISHNNAYEGRDPELVPDALRCGFVAELLGVGVPQLAELLTSLEQLGLVAPAPDGGLRLVDVRALEDLADAH
jgi:hypothetical protein